MVSAAVMSQVGNARLIKELINAYFVDVYPCTIFSFLHRATFIKAVEDESVSLCLLLAVCAISAKFVLTDAAPAQKWIAEAKRQAMMEIENGRMTSATLGSLVICFHFDLYARDLVAAWMTSGSAIRSVYNGTARRIADKILDWLSLCDLIHLTQTPKNHKSPGCPGSRSSPGAVSCGPST